MSQCFALSYVLSQPCDKCKGTKFTLEWLTSIDGDKICQVCGYKTPLNLKVIICDKQNIQCNYRLHDGTCAPKTRYGYLFECFIKR